MRFISLRSPTTAFIHDLIAIPAAWYAAFWLRFNLGEIPHDYLVSATQTLPFLIVVHGAVFWFVGLYRGVWRFASLPDLMRIAQAVVLGVLISTVVLFMLTRIEGIPRSVIPLFGIMLMGFLGVPRFLYRIAKDHNFRPKPGKRVLIVGAGMAGEILVREITRGMGDLYNPVAFVDDNRRTRGMEIHGIPVVGKTADLEKAVTDHSIDMILLALPNARGPELRRIIERCENTGVEFRIVPPTQDIISGRTRVSALREVSIEDLLGRDQVSLDWGRICAELGGRRVLVTGGGGSIGSELCRQICRAAPSQLIVIDQSEFNLYSIEMELRGLFPDLELIPRLVDVTDATALDAVFSACKPQVVFHAAAYKHVPILEDQVREAVSNNVLGTRLTALAADRHGVESFVMISTDKAVNPANIMGATKRVSEIFCQNLNMRSQTHFITVRFGNVLGSAGSVVPLFHKQIAAGGPVTVTHPEVKRYFMTIPEASQLILQAAATGNGGEIFVLDMGEPVKISFLAEQMIRLSGKVPNEDIEIRYIGLRPGEKLFEELVHDQEPLMSTPHERILLARFREVQWAHLQSVMKRMEEACERFDDEALRRELLGLVPESSFGAATESRKPDSGSVVKLVTNKAQG